MLRTQQLYVGLSARTFVQQLKQRALILFKLLLLEKKVKLLGRIWLCGKRYIYLRQTYQNYNYLVWNRSHINIATLLYSPWEKNLTSKVIQKSEVLNLRCINVCQYCKYYLKYWSKGINGPLDPWGGQNFQCFMKWDGLTGRAGVRWRAQINFLSKTSILNPSVHPPASSETISL